MLSRNARDVIQSQLAKLQERFDAINRELMTCIKMQGDVMEGVTQKSSGENDRTNCKVSLYSRCTHFGVSRVVCGAHLRLVCAAGRAAAFAVDAALVAFFALIRATD